jgi:hypothetical protein
MASHSDKVVYGKVVFGKRISSSFPGLFPSSRGAGEEVLEPHVLAAACVQEEGDRKISTNSVAARTAQATSSTPWRVPFAQQGAHEPGLEALFRSNIKLCDPVQSAPNATSVRVSTAHVQTADEDRKMPAKPSANAQGEVSSTTTGSNTQQQRSGAVVSQGLVLDSEGKPRPHEVRVPFDAPRAYQAFPEDKSQPSAQDAREQGRTQSMLQSVAAYQEVCTADTAFQSQRRALAKLEEQLKRDTTNEALSRQYQEQEAEFQQHLLYQQGCDLAKEVQKLREAESSKADHIILSKAEMQLGVGREKLKQREQHRKAATGIRDDLLQPEIVAKVSVN